MPLRSGSIEKIDALLVTLESEAGIVLSSFPFPSFSSPQVPNYDTRRKCRQSACMPCLAALVCIWRGCAESYVYVLIVAGQGDPMDDGHMPYGLRSPLSECNQARRISKVVQSLGRDCPIPAWGPQKNIRPDNPGKFARVKTFRCLSLSVRSFVSSSFFFETTNGECFAALQSAFSSRQMQTQISYRHCHWAHWLTRYPYSRASKL